MPRSTLENPFTPHRDRSADDPALVGKILGPEAEAAMRKGMKPHEKQELDPAIDLELTEDQRTQSEQERRERSPEWKMEQARKELIVWAKKIGKEEAWVDETFTIHPDGTLTVEGDLMLSGLPVTHLPRGLRKVGRTLDISSTGIISLDSFPQEIGGSINLGDTKITSLKGLSLKIGGHLNLRRIPIRSLEGIPPPENIRGVMIFSHDQKRLEERAKEKGYRIGKH